MKQLLLLLIILFFMSACTTDELPTAVPQQATAVVATTPAEPTPTLAQRAPTEPAATSPGLPTEVLLPPATLPPAASPAPDGAMPPEVQEAILIQEPGPGWRLTSPIHVAGMADPTFEQNLVVRLLLDDGTVIALTPVTIAADVGQRGPFAVDVPFTVSGERQAFLQVYTESARDGGVTHLSSVGLTIADGGPENRPPFTPMSERIIISQPLFNTVVSGGIVHVAGVALASFEQTLLIEILDESGTVIGSAPVMTNAPDLGMFGPFQADIPYTAGVTGAGRVVVRDISPAFGGDVHLASVEIRLE